MEPLTFRCGRDVAPPWPVEQKGSKRVFAASVMQHTTEPGLYSEMRYMLHHCSVRNEWVSERAIAASVVQHTITFEVGEMLHHGGYRTDGLAFVGYGRNASASIASLDATLHRGGPTFEMREMLHHWMQHTTEVGPLSREKRCITAGYGRNALVTVASSDTTHHGGGPTFEMREMLHHWMQHNRGGPTFKGEEMHHCRLRK